MNDSQALTVREADAELPGIVKAPITPAQAKIDAVANLTMKAYERASTLQLTSEEVAALQADFPDEAFQPGAAGKESLIYIEHAHLRDRLNQVFGPGQWSIVPRNRWAEDFSFVNKYKETVEASRVYVEAMLCIRGCFVAEAVGDMVYYKNNESQNYGDAVEGAKTAALRRCAKELGIGLQAWKKTWCEGWWNRRKGNRQPNANVEADRKPANVTRKAAPAAQAKTTAKPPDPDAPATEEQRVRWVKQLKTIEDKALAYGYANGILLPQGKDFPGEPVECWPLNHTPSTKWAAEKLFARIQAWKPAGASGPPSTTAGQPSGASQGNVERNKAIPDHHSAEWFNFVMPWGKQAGTILGKLDKKYLYGLWKNYTVEVEYNGKPKSKATIEKDRLFRVFLDMAGVHYRFDEPADSKDGVSSAESMSEAGDDVPF